MQIKICRVREGTVLPEYQTAGAAGFDFHARIDEPVILPARGTVAVPTGISLEIPEGYELQVRGRSGLAFKHGIGLVNGVGTIDSDYRGELSVILANWKDDDFVIEPGMRIAQGVVSKFERVEWDEVAELSETERKGGFGSTGLGRKR